MKVLVTGGTGFTGSHLCQRLVSEGYTVRALVRDLHQATELHAYGVELSVGDLRDPESLAKATKGVDIVYHIAAVFRQENVARKVMWVVNVLGTRNLLEAARNAGVKRFVHCSTIGVHGDVKNPPADETSPYAPGDYYQRSKLAGEIIAQEYLSNGKPEVVIFRPAGIYGPGDMRFLKLFRAISNRSFVMVGSGNIHYHMVYIDDLIEGILLCGLKEEACGNIYILAGEEIVTLNQLVQLIAEVLSVPPPRFRIPFAPVYTAGFIFEVLCKPVGIHPPLYRRRVDFFRKNRAFSIEKAKMELGFHPKIDLENGLRKTAAWYQQQGLL